MKKISVGIVFAMAVAGASLVFAQPHQGGAAAGDDVAGNEMIKDEGYGNEDVEYYGSEDDLVNEEGYADNAAQEEEPGETVHAVANAQK